MEIVLALFVLVGGSIAFSAWKKSRSAEPVQTPEQTDQSDDRRHVRNCSACSYQGEMKTWIANHGLPKLLIVIGFILGYIPGLIFLIYYWGKYKCPQCGAVGKNSAV